MHFCFWCIERRLCAPGLPREYVKVHEDLCFSHVDFSFPHIYRDCTLPAPASCTTVLYPCPWS